MTKTQEKKAKADKARAEKLATDKVAALETAATKIGKCDDARKAAFDACYECEKLGLKQIDLRPFLMLLGYTKNTATKLCSEYWPTRVSRKKKPTPKLSTQVKGEKALVAAKKRWARNTKAVVIVMAIGLGITADDLIVDED